MTRAGRIDHVRIDGEAARGADGRCGRGAGGRAWAPAAAHGLGPRSRARRRPWASSACCSGAASVRWCAATALPLIPGGRHAGDGDRRRRAAANADENPDVLWALRGGKPALGVVTEVGGLRLVALPALYGGRAVLRGGAHRACAAGLDRLDRAGAARGVTTSVGAIVRFPSRDTLPPALRGRRLLTLRFAFPGDAGGRRAAGRAAARRSLPSISTSWAPCRSPT